MPIKTFHIVLLALLLLFNWQDAIAFDTDPDKDFSQDLTSRELHIALVPEKNIFEQRRRYRYITDYLSKRSGIKITIDIMNNYGQIIESFLDGRADAGFFGSFSYVLTNEKTNIEPIARPVLPNGKSTYRGYLLARKDSGIENVAAMRGKTLVLVDKATTAGNIFQLFYFNSFGITQPENYFTKIYFAGSHDAAAWAVYTGEADVGGCKDTIFNELAEQYPDFREQMNILVESPEVPSNGLAVRKDLNPAIKLRLKGLLLNLDKTAEGQAVLEKFGAQKFIETRREDYLAVYNMIESLNIDLKLFPYKNE